MSNWESKEAITNSFEFNVSLGRYGGYITRWDVFAKSESLSSTLQDVWTLDHDLTYTTVGEVLFIKSSSASDTSIYASIEGLDEDGYFQTAEVLLNGKTAVGIPKFWLRILRVRPTNGITNLGAWTIATVTGTPAETEIRGHVIAGTSTQSGSSYMSHFTVPKGYIALLQNYTTSQVGNSDIDFIALARVQDGSFIPRDAVNGDSNRNFDMRILGELTDFKVMAKASSSLNRDVPVSYYFYLVRKELANFDGIRIMGKGDM